ncbi:MAG: efflux RND transporter periplasmic adaptor subunit, partial [Lachnospiraceae bacterium]|nr:efflux RND transporter periplasmic adaptor subunit [Lachnospiraceae bacterium]
MALASKGKKKFLVILLIVVVVGVVGASWFTSQQKKKAALAAKSAVTQISTATVEQMDLSNSISLTGTLESVTTRTISSDIKDVEVSSVLVQVGQYVEEGEILCILDSSELEEDLVTAKNNQSVNDALDALSGSALENYQETLAEAQETLDKAANSAATKGAAYEEAVATYGEDSSEASQALSSYTQAESSALSARSSYEETVEKALETYQKALLEEQLISEDSDQTKIETLTEEIAACTITAPMSGTIAELSVQEGDEFSGGTIVSMLDNEHFKITATVDEYDINSICLGQKAFVKTNATGDEELPATVTYVAVTSSSSQMSTSASYQVEITLDEAQSLLRTGMTASVSIELEGAYGVLAVPYDCVTTRNGASYVTLVDGDTQTEVEVTTGLETDYYVEISGEGITAGSSVLLPTTIISSQDEEEMGFNFNFGGNMGGDMGSGGPGGSG